MHGIETYRKMERAPEDALKTIGGGRLKGFTDITPQWRIEILTEIFGLCGIGWKYSIDKLWTEDGTAGEKMAFSLISLYVRDGDKWSDAIPGIGGSALVEMERTGLHSSDEGYKMATTDALSVACKSIGVAAAIYRGQWDGSKYRDKKGPQTDEEALGDVRDSKGKYSPEASPGTPATRGDGIAMKMRAIKFDLANIIATEYEGKRIFSKEDAADMNAAWHPGGRDLIASEADLTLITGVRDAWTQKRDAMLAAHKEMDKEGLF
jgi:hypothetical protein